MQLPNIPFVVLDTETTGFVPKVNRVIEYAHVVYREGSQVDEYDELVSVPVEIPSVVQIITRIRPEHLEGKQTFEQQLPEIQKRIGKDTVIVGQNIMFDIRMLKGEGIDLSERPWIDTSMLASLVFPELESYSLGYVSAVLNLNHAPVHRALGDVRATLELLSKCWERLLELPQDMVMDIKATMNKSAPGYTQLFDALPTSDTTTRPAWMQVPEPKKFPGMTRKLTLKKPEIGVVDMIEESLDPMMLQSVIDAAAKDTSTVHWIAVKNLTAMVKRLKLSDEVRVLQPPFLLLDTEAAETLCVQEKYSADEATLVTKLDWYAPKVFADAPIHGEERSVWNGKLTCLETSKTYTDQFTDLPSVMLIDHRQLLAFVADPDHAAHGALNADAHIIIDDASMLEDTASKAYGHYCGLNNLRAASEGHEKMTKFTDLLQIWIEKTRNEQDVRFLAHSDLTAPQAEALCAQIKELLTDTALLPQTLKQLEAVLHCLEEEALKRITWIETRQDGSQFLHSVPESVAELMKADLYEKYPVTMLIPPQSAGIMQETLHRSTITAVNTQIQRVQDGVDISFPKEIRGSTVVSDPPDGKTVILAGSRRVIEEYFVKYTEDLEARDITLICQSFSGGVNRMQAEFLAAKGTAVWVLTPWTFEGVELPPGTVDHLVMDALPFDNPSQPVFSIRAEHFDNPFVGYSMPRLLHRLFRILRTFRRIAKGDADVTVIDNRITEKRYGTGVQKYMEMFCAKLSEKSSTDKPNSDYPENWQMNLL
jgi:DNA polymerase III epsilon subunit-like protein